MKAGEKKGARKMRWEGKERHEGGQIERGKKGRINGKGGKGGKRKRSLKVDAGSTSEGGFSTTCKGAEGLERQKARRETWMWECVEGGVYLNVKGMKPRARERSFWKSRMRKESRVREGGRVRMFVKASVLFFGLDEGRGGRS